MDRKRSDDRIAFCSVCGEEPVASTLAMRYPNVVCEQCSNQAVDQEGESVPSQSSGNVRVGDAVPKRPVEPNPVFIEGHKCWRLYRSEGGVTLRDAHDCSTLDEFTAKHFAESHRPIQSYSRVRSASERSNGWSADSIKEFEVPAEVGHALTAPIDPVVRLHLSPDDPDVLDGVGWTEVYETEGVFVIGDFAPTWSKWYVVPKVDISQLLKGLTSERWEVRSCSLEPDPEWLSLYR